MKKDYEQAQAVVQVVFSDDEWFNDDHHHGSNDYGGFQHCSTADSFLSEAQRNGCIAGAKSERTHQQLQAAAAAVIDCRRLAPHCFTNLTPVQL